MLRELPPLSVACLAQAISKDDDLPEPLLTWLDPLSTFLLSMSTEKRVGTVGFYYQTILAYLRYAKAEPIALQDFRRKHLDAFLVERAHLSENSKTHYKKCLKKFFAWCEEDGHIASDPLAKLKVPMPSQADVYHPTADDLKRILSAVQSYWKQPIRCGVVPMPAKEKRFYMTHNFALLCLLIDTGCRIGEACGIHLEDIRLDGEPYIILRKQKGGGQRSIPISPFCINAIRAYLSVRPKGTPNNPVAPHLFLTVSGSPYSPDAATKRMRTYRQIADIPRCTIHSLRRYALTGMAEVDLLSAQNMGGHKDSKTTQLYLKLRGKHLMDKHREANLLGQVVGEEVRLQRDRKKRV